MSSDKNPWGQSGSNSNSKGSRPNSGGPRGPRPSGGGHSGGPDMDEIFKNLQDQLQGNVPGGGKLIGLGVLIIVALWLASGFYTVNPSENAVIQRFGAHHRTQVTQGLGYHLPAPIETMTKINVTEVRKMTIGFSEFGSRSGTSKRDIPEESQMLTSDENIVDLDLVIQWKISSAEEYLFNIQDQVSTIKKVAESAIREVVGQTKMFPIITNARDQVAERVKQIMVENLNEYKSGVNIQQVLIQQAEVHPDVQSAFQDVQSANQDAERLKNEAQKYKEDILPRARGDAQRLLQEAKAYEQSQVAKATGDADRFEAVYRAYVKGKDVTKERIYLETMESVFSNAKTVIIDQKGGSGVVPYLPLNELNKSTSGK